VAERHDSRGDPAAAMAGRRAGLVITRPPVTRCRNRSSGVMIGGATSAADGPSVTPTETALQLRRRLAP